MKKLSTIALDLLLLAGCTKNKQHISLQAQKETTKTSPKPSDVSQTDTIFFFFEDSEKQKEYVLVRSLNQTFDKDSMCTAKFQLDFIKHRKQIGSHQIEIKGFDQGSDWSGSLELDSIASPLKNLRVGYAACGYIQTNFLFYADAAKVDLIHQWISMSDSGWGTWGEVISGVPQNFYFRMQSFSPDDNDQEMGINEFSDSTHFELKNKQWVKTRLTPKDKPYRTKKLSFNEFHKS